MRFTTSSNRYALTLGLAGVLIFISVLFFMAINFDVFTQRVLDRAFAENGLAETIQNITLLISAVCFFVFAKKVDQAHKPVLHFLSALSMLLFSREFALGLSDTSQDQAATLDTLKSGFRGVVILALVVCLFKILKSWNVFKGSLKLYVMSASALACYCALAFILSAWPFDRIKGLVANPTFFEEFLEVNGYLMWCLCSCILHRDINSISKHLD